MTGRFHYYFYYYNYYYCFSLTAVCVAQRIQDAEVAHNNAGSDSSSDVDVSPHAQYQCAEHTNPTSKHTGCCFTIG